MRGWWPFWLTALTLLCGAMGATMASPLFPLYEAAWGISHATITLLYVAYMFGVLGSLMFLTRFTDRIGAVRMLRIGSGMLALGLLLSALIGGLVGGRETGVAALLPVRFLIGIASGVLTSAATVGLFRLEPAPGRIAAMVASLTTMAGFSLGPIVCGLVAQFAPAPLVVPYLVVLAVVGLLGLGLMRLRADPGSAVARDVSSGGPGSGPGSRAGGARSFLPNLALPEPGRIAGFLVVASAVFSAYALFSLLASLAPSFLPMILPWHGPAVSGLAVGLVLTCSALVQLPARRLSPRPCLRLALGIMIVGTLTLLVAMRLGNASLFIVAEFAIGCGHGLAFLAGMTLLGLIATGPRRGAILSTHLSIGYLGAIVPTLVVGWLADHLGLAPAVMLFCASFALICAVLLALSRLVGAMRLGEGV